MRHAAKPEKQIQTEIQLAASQLGARLFRLQVGNFKTEDGRWVAVGIPGMSDLIGIAPDGRYLAVEVKREGGKATPEQLAFIQMVRAHGGIAGVCRSVSDFEDLLAGHVA